MNTVTIELSRYDELLHKEAQMEVLRRFVGRDFTLKDEMLLIVGELVEGVSEG